MSPIEVSWFAENLKRYATPDLSPLLNLGSSTESYRKEVCPYIENELFSPLLQRGVKVLHADLKDAQGVDFVGDVLDPNVRSQLRDMEVKAVLCNNMLEHVTDIDAMCKALNEICPSGGILGVSVPYQYPFHPDPIDNGYRPNLEQLGELLSQFGFKLIHGEEVSFGNYAKTLLNRPRLLLRDVYMLAMGFVRKDKWRVLFGNYHHLIKDYKVTCAIFVSCG